MKYPRVLIGGPTSVHKAYCLAQLKSAVDKLKKYPNAEILFTDNTWDDGEFAAKMRRMGIPTIHIKPESQDVPTRKRLIDCRNYLRKKCLDEGFDYFMSFESDLEPLYPVDEDIVMRMISHGKQVVSGVYNSLKCSKGLKHCPRCNKHFADGIPSAGRNLGIPMNQCNRCDGPLNKMPSHWTELPMVWTWADERIKDSDLIRMFDLHGLYIETIRQGRSLIQVQSTGVGCLMIHRSALAKVEFRYMPDRLSCDDMFFAIDCRGQNPPIDIWVDTEIVLKHNYREWRGSYKLNR